MKRLPVLIFSLLTLVCVATEGLDAAAVSATAQREAFEKARKEAEVVAEVRVLTALCQEATKKGDRIHAVTLQVALQVLAVESGPLKKNEIVVVSHHVTLPRGPGPGTYDYTVALHQFPFTPGVKGSVALRWNAEKRAYMVVSGWVAEPNHAEIPKEVGVAFSAKNP